MKKTLLAILSLTIGISLSAQCFMQVSCNWVTCFGGCDGTATAFPVGMVQPISYQWMPGGQTTPTITGLCAGTYTCMAIDSLGCTATAQCTVGSPAQLQAVVTNFVPPSCSSCCDGSASGSASGGTPGYTYLWTGPSLPPFPGANVNGLCVGTYTFCVTDANGCTSCTTLVSQVPQTIAENSPVVTLSVSPNPVEQTSFMNCTFVSPQAGEVVITNVLGEVVSSTSFAATRQVEMKIDLSSQPEGVYFVTVSTGAGSSSTRLVKQ